MIREKKAQSAVLGILVLLVLLILAAGLVDIYRAFAARNWAYSVAQEAALIGVSSGRDWNGLAVTGEVRLDEAAARTAAEQIVIAEMSARGVDDYTLIIQIQPEPDGGRVEGFPPRPVRLGTGKGAWQTDEPAVGVYLEAPVDWLLLDAFGIEEKNVAVFASAGVAK